MTVNCPDCGGRVVRDDGYYVCSNCGLVVGDVVVCEPQRTEEGEVVGVGPPAMFGEDLQATVISHAPATPSERRRMTPQGAYRIRRLAATSRRALRDEARLNRFLNEIRRIGKLPEISLDRTTVEEAVMLGRVVYKKKLTRGRPADVLAAGIIAIVCSRSKHLVTLGSLAKGINVRVRDLRKCVTFLKKRLGISYVSLSCKDWLHPTVFRVLDVLNIPQDRNEAVISTAKKIHEAMEKKGLLSGKSPRCMALAITVVAVEAATGRKIRPSEVSTLSEEGKTTLAKRIKEVRSVYESIMRKKAKQ